MTSGQHFFLRTPLRATSLLVESARADFDVFLEETYSEDELSTLEPRLEELAMVLALALPPEINFDDFYGDPKCEAEQRTFFEGCCSMVVLENLPYLDQNPFQVTFLQILLGKIDECLVDPGGTRELCFKEAYLRELDGYRSSESKKKVSLSTPVSRPGNEDPVARDLELARAEMVRIQRTGLQDELEKKIHALASERLRSLCELLKIESIDADGILSASGLNPKDFGDHLERLKLVLKNIKNL